MGRRPIATVAPPIIDRVMTRVFFRPMRSPMWEKTMPPKGRMKKVSDSDRYDSINEMTGSSLGKNCLSKISAAAVAYRKKSNHSMALPLRLPMSTRRLVAGWPTADCWEDTQYSSCRGPRDAGLMM